MGALTCTTRCSLLVLALVLRPRHHVIVVVFTAGACVAVLAAARAVVCRPCTALAVAIACCLTVFTRLLALPAASASMIAVYLQQPKPKAAFIAIITTFAIIVTLLVADHAPAVARVVVFSDARTTGAAPLPVPHSPPQNLRRAVLAQVSVRLSDAQRDGRCSDHGEHDHTGHYPRPHPWAGKHTARCCNCVRTVCVSE